MVDQSTAESMDGDAAVHEAFRALGCPEKLLTRAISTFGTVELAKRWTDVLGKRPFDPVYLYEIAMSGLRPEDYLRWRDAGLDPVAALQLPRHLAKAGLGIDDYLRWRSAGLGKGLRVFVPFLMAGLAFDDLLYFVADWNRDSESRHSDGISEFREMLTSGVDLDEFRRQLATGLSGHQIYAWRKAGIPESEWQTWLTLGFDAESAVEYWRGGVAAAAAKPWADLGLSPTDALTLMAKRVTVAVAREWITAGIAGAACLKFIAKGVPLEVAKMWISRGFSPDDAVDYIGKRVSIDDAVNFEKRGIEPWQVKRTKNGLKLKLHPWQKDPADRLPDVIKPGRIKFTLWTDVPGGNRRAEDITLKWDGHHTAEWSEVISGANKDLDPVAGSPAWGVASWPDGRDVLLTYTWDEFALTGYARLPGVAPVAGPEGARNPRNWIRFGEALVKFVLLDLGSGHHERHELAAMYYWPADDKILELDDIFRIYLDSVGKSEVAPEFDEWLRCELSSGVYTTDVDSVRLAEHWVHAGNRGPRRRAAKRTDRKSPSQPSTSPSRLHRGGLGRHQRRIIELLRNATADGLAVDEVAKLLSRTPRSAEVALEKLAQRQIIVLTSGDSIAWLPERRLAWLRANAASIPSAAEEISELSVLVEQQRTAQTPAKS